MNRFFEHQQRARRNTSALIVLMAVAIAGIGSAIYFALSTILALRRERAHLYGFTDTTMPDAQVWVLCVLGVAIFVVGASLWRFRSLQSGAHIAESMGGHLVSGRPRDPLERRLLNVVEEMAIASGVAVPRVFVLGEERGINAFAAGHELDDAVIAVTRGCLEKLTREELQGVIAHEFSHVLNGDMRLNLKLVGVIYGIVCIGLAGRLALELAGRATLGGRSFGGSRRRGEPFMLVIAFFGLVVFVLGLVGELCGKLIRAAVSRQREFLADASAVQFTRNPQGISAALRKIGGYDFGARIDVSAAEEASHFFFGDIHQRGFFARVFATHPVLAERIRRIDPSFDGAFPAVGPGIAEPDEPMISAFAAGATRGADRSFAPAAVVDQVGQLEAAAVEQSARTLLALPAALREATANSYAACAIVYGLLLPDGPELRASTLERLAPVLGPALVGETQRLLPALDALPRRDRLPLVALLGPALRALSAAQRAGFKRAVDALIHADQQVTLFEYVLGYTLERSVSAQPRPRARHKALSVVRAELELLLSLLAHAGAQGDSQTAVAAFQAASARLPEQTLSLLPSSPRLVSGLAPALDAMRGLTAPLRARVVDACAHAALANREVSEHEWTLLRAVCAALHCPLPPLGDALDP